MGPERKFYQKVKKCFTDISLIRIENNSLLGTPDLLGYNASGHFFTLELKVTRSKKIKFSPHQIAFHVKHPKNSFILVEHLGQRSVKLFSGSMIHELDACGLALEPLCLTLDACCSFFQELGAWSLTLGACRLRPRRQLSLWRPPANERTSKRSVGFPRSPRNWSQVHCLMSGLS